MVANVKGFQMSEDLLAVNTGEYILILSKQCVVFGFLQVLRDIYEHSINKDKKVKFRVWDWQEQEFIEYTEKEFLAILQNFSNWSVAELKDILNAI